MVARALEITGLAPLVRRPVAVLSGSPMCSARRPSPSAQFARSNGGEGPRKIEASAVAAEAADAPAAEASSEADEPADGPHDAAGTVRCNEEERDPT